MDSYQSKALESWYKEGHELRLDPLHPLLGLAGECGELLNLYKKDKFKPGVSWWNCKHCNKEKHEGPCHPYAPLLYYVPLILDELGDVWYYLRIVCWQQNIKMNDIKGQDYYFWVGVELLARMANNATIMLDDYLFDKKIDISRLQVLWGCLIPLLKELDCSIDKLTELNYQKLNTPSQNGWSSAR